MRDFAEIQHHARQLAGMSGVDLEHAPPRTCRLWEARALAMFHLGAGDKAEAHKVMAPFKRPNLQRNGGSRHG